jgi:hypothetical protein
MDWMNWKTWSVVGVIIVAAFAIYTFAATDSARIATDDTAVVATARTTTARNTRAQAPLPGVTPVHVEWLDGQTGSYRSERNLFAYREPPPPPPPPQPSPPPDKDKDGVPDFSDNCPNLVNGDQADVDRNGIGDACQTTPVIAPPPPPPPAPVPPQFPFKYIGTFGTPGKPIATFASNGEIINVRPGETFDSRFILRSIGIESVDIGYVGFPPDVKTRIALGQ